MNKFHVSLLAALLLMLNGCGDKGSDKKAEVSQPAAMANVTKPDEKFGKLQKEAEAGNADAQNTLGWMFANGHGAPQNSQEAIKWFRLAAGQGNTSAQLALGQMYRNGQGVEQDHVKAQMWIILAVAKGNSEAKQVFDIATQHMTPAQIAEAKRMAQDCESSNYKKCGQPE
jgi:TPR repeat protein